MTGSLNPENAEAILAKLAGVFLQTGAQPNGAEDLDSPNVEARYRALVEQIPAVVFMAYLDKGMGEAYVSPQIEKALGFSQSEWLEDPIRWYQQIHPEDKSRWSMEAAEMFLSGKPLRSSYRVIARDGHLIWFQCEAKMIRRPDGRPWFIHGVGFDITELKRTEAELHQERDVLSAILDTVGALVVVLDPRGRIVRFNRACEHTTGYFSSEVHDQFFWDLLPAPEERDRCQAMFDQLRHGAACSEYESACITRTGERRIIRWSTSVLPGADSKVRYMIATGIDITERKRLEAAILDISNSEQRRIGQDLHDGLGQHLTGIAFMTKVLEQRLVEKSLPESADVTKIVKLVNEAIHRTRELARGLLPVLSDSSGLMSALQQFAGEIEDLFQISCRFDCHDPVLIENRNVANHLYRIAQEAVHNAVRHGHAKRIVIRLDGSDCGGGSLYVQDDGCGIACGQPGSSGMGLHIMRYRAGMIGGSLEVKRAGERGTTVACRFSGQAG
jgi:PAS domain S-box-containing protein